MLYAIVELLLGLVLAVPQSFNPGCQESDQLALRQLVDGSIVYRLVARRLLNIIASDGPNQLWGMAGGSTAAAASR